MEITKQVSVFLENKPGHLANALSALAREKINITAMTVMDSHEHNVLRFVTNDLGRTVQVLKDLGMPHAEADVLLVEFATSRAPWLTSASCWRRTTSTSTMPIAAPAAAMARPLAFSKSPIRRKRSAFSMNPPIILPGAVRSGALPRPPDLPSTWRDGTLKKVSGLMCRKPVPSSGGGRG